MLGLLAEVRTEVEELYEHAEDVLEGEMGFLDVHGGVGRDDDVDVREGFHGAAVVAGIGDGVEAEGASEREGANTVLGVTGGGDGEEDVAGLAEGLDLTLEDVIEGVVVADGGEDAGVGGEGDGAEGGAVDGEAGDELGDKVLGIGGRATVATDEEFAAGLHGVGGEAGGFDDRGMDGFVVEDTRHGVDGLGELAANDVDHGAWLR